MFYYINQIKKNNENYIFRSTNKYFECMIKTNVYAYNTKQFLILLIWTYQDLKFIFYRWAVSLSKFVNGGEENCMGWRENYF